MSKMGDSIPRVTSEEKQSACVVCCNAIMQLLRCFTYCK